ENHLEKGGLAAAVGAGDHQPFGPADLQVDRSEPPLPAGRDRTGKGGHTVPGTPRVGEIQVKLPALPGFLRLTQALECPFGGSHLGRLLLGAVDEKASLRLVGVLRLLGRTARALLRPGPLRADPRAQAVPLGLQASYAAEAWERAR